MIIAKFSKCPICGCKDTVCRLACADDASIPEGAFISLEKMFTPIQDMTKLISPTIKGILCHYDVCAKCGHRYCTQAEITSMPVEIRHQSGSVIKTLAK